MHASTIETNARPSETNAITIETNARTSETNARTSETNARTNETMLLYAQGGIPVRVLPLLCALMFLSPGGADGKCLPRARAGLFAMLVSHCGFDLCTKCLQHNTPNGGHWGATGFAQHSDSIVRIMFRPGIV